MSQCMLYNMVKYVSVKIVYKILNDTRKHLSSVERILVHQCVYYINVTRWQSYMYGENMHRKVCGAVSIESFLNSDFILKFSSVSFFKLCNKNSISYIL